MFVRWLVSVFILLSAIGVSPVYASEKEKEGGPAGSAEIRAKLAPAYIAVPKLHMAVQVDSNRKYRSLELEVWLLQSDPEKHQILNSKKKQIAEQMREDFSAYNWEAFEDSSGGPAVAKKVVAASVQEATGTTVEDVMIKTLVLK